MKLKDLPKRMQTKRWISSEIRHERATGIHTYHTCECGRKQCRSNACILCWEEVLKELTGCTQLHKETKAQKQTRLIAESLDY